MTAPLMVDVTGWLIGRLTTTLTAARVTSELPSDITQPTVRVLRIGGPNDGVILDTASMAFHCFDTTDRAARQLGYQVITAVYGLQGHAAAGAVLTQARTLSGPSWAPTENPGLRHAVVLMQTRIKTTG